MYVISANIPRERGHFFAEKFRCLFVAIETLSKRPRKITGRDASVIVAISKAGSRHTIYALFDGKALFDLPKAFVALCHVMLRDHHT